MWSHVQSTMSNLGFSFNLLKFNTRHCSSFPLKFDWWTTMNYYACIYDIVINIFFPFSQKELIPCLHDRDVMTLDQMFGVLESLWWVSHCVLFVSGRDDVDSNPTLTTTGIFLFSSPLDFRYSRLASSCQLSILNCFLWIKVGCLWSGLIAKWTENNTRVLHFLG